MCGLGRNGWNCGGEGSDSQRERAWLGGRLKIGILRLPRISWTVIGWWLYLPLPIYLLWLLGKLGTYSGRRHLIVLLVVYSFIHSSNIHSILNILHGIARAVNSTTPTQSLLQLIRNTLLLHLLIPRRRSHWLRSCFLSTILMMTTFSCGWRDAIAS